MQYPVASKKPDAGAGYRSLADNLAQFHELGELPQQVDLRKLDEGQRMYAAIWQSGTSHAEIIIRVLC